MGRDAVETRGEGGVRGVPAPTQREMKIQPRSMAFLIHISTTASVAMTPKATPRRKARREGPGLRTRAMQAPRLVARPATVESTSAW